MSAQGLGCAKTPAVAPHVEISPGNCIPESQIILHTRGSMPCWRIVFSTFYGCMSFYTGSVKMRKPRSEHMWAGLPPITDLVDALGAAEKVESRMGAVAWAMRQRSVSHPRSSNRTCGFPASGSPTGFVVRHTEKIADRKRHRAA